MGQVVKLSDFRRARADHSDPVSGDSLVPIEFAVGFSDRNDCLKKIAEYGVRAIHIRRVKDEPDALLYLMGVKDAIWMNKKILEREEISDDEIAHRIDLVQMLENVDFSMMDCMWESFTRQGNFSAR
ncbi:MAG: hypothetical protein GKR91_03130 [Pseudomonadales bacterium]|nr:hypothetical protein [Pseudomonadales bacterium]